MDIGIVEVAFALALEVDTDQVPFLGTSRHGESFPVQPARTNRAVVFLDNLVVMPREIMDLG